MLKFFHKVSKVTEAETKLTSSGFPQYFKIKILQLPLTKWKLFLVRLRYDNYIFSLSRSRLHELLSDNILTYTSTVYVSNSSFFSVFILLFEQYISFPRPSKRSKTFQLSGNLNSD